MALRKMAGRALACWIGLIPLIGQTVVKVEQGGTGAASAAGARTKLGAAAEVHTHAIGQIDGVAGKSGSSTVLQTFGGGATASGECAQYDAAGNLISSGEPCGGRENYSQQFSESTSVVLTHNLGTLNVLVECFDQLDAKVEPGGVTIPNVNTAIVAFAVPQTGRCVVSGTASGAAGGGGAVASVFGRTGAVTAQAGDYSFSQITGTLGLSKGGTNQGTWTAGRCVQVSSDGTRLESAGTNCATGSVASVFGRTGTVSAQTGDYGFAQISGIAGVGQGGTGASTAATARTNLLPGYAGQSGKCLKVTGTSTDVEWGDCVSGGLTVTAGAGIEVSGTTISVDTGAVPSSMTASATLAGWSGGVIAAHSCAELNFPLPGATSGDAIAAGWPPDLAAGLTGTMYATANGAVVVRLCNVTASSVSAPENRTFRATILRTF
ncbi:MAG: hypothetical protein IH602_08580 [Bryobacteraceae bacterium]|nr:hypothetical protein [Bryobacteraceae bacterium]